MQASGRIVPMIMKLNHNPLLVQPANWKVLISRDSNISFLETVGLPSLELFRSFFAEFLLPEFFRYHHILS
jgi:hypothetical protein